MATHVYRLHVTYPEGSHSPGWQPDNWDGWGTGYDDLDGFRWPTERLYLSRSGAHRRARLFRSYGATVTVERSEPVAWDHGAAVGWYWCPLHEVRWSADYVLEHGRLSDGRVCQSEGCTLYRLWTDPNDAVDLGAVG